jgi:hypothetical protein
VKPLIQGLPGALAELLRGAPLSPAKVDFAWKAAVGAALERTTAVHLEGTRLLVDAVSAQWASEIVRSQHVILSRLQLLLGKDVVTAIEVRRRQT